MKPLEAALRRLSGSTFMVSMRGARVDRHRPRVSTASKMASLSSCMSLL